MMFYGKQCIDESDILEVVDTLRSDFLTTGPKVLQFESAISKYTGSTYAVAVSSGTSALHLASLSLLNRNDKVLTTPNSFLATANSILYANAVPIFVDISDDGNIDLDLCEQELKKDDSIRSIYSVWFSGNPLDQQKLKYLKDKYSLIILEDCCHALGAKEGEVKAGSCMNSDCSVFSFHPVKQITTGEGGVITTNNHDLYEKLLCLRNHGIYKDSQMKPWEYEMRDLGFNYRLTDVACALGLSQLSKADSFVQRRRQIAQWYDCHFKDSIVKPLYCFNKDSAYHLYVVQLDFSKLNINKEELFFQMRKKGISLQVHYMPINKQPYYQRLGYGHEDTPCMEEYYENSFSLPIYVSLKDDDLIYIKESLLEVLGEN